jgi:hypothetical protein
MSRSHCGTWAPQIVPSHVVRYRGPSVSIVGPKRAPGGGGLGGPVADKSRDVACWPAGPRCDKIE